MSNSVQSIARAMGIIEEITKHNNSISITELSKTVDLHKSTVHRLLKSLIELGYVRQNISNNHYELTIKLFEIGSTVIRQNDLITIAKPHLEHLRDLSKEVVHLVIPDQTDIIYIDKMESTQTLRMHSYVGKRAPMYCTAVGKAILSSRSDNEITEFWNTINPIKYTDNTIVTLDIFMEELKEINKTGISYDNEEQELNIKCISTSLIDFSGNVVGAISISGPKQRMTEHLIETLIPELLEAKKSISKEFGQF